MRELQRRLWWCWIVVEDRDVFWPAVPLGVLLVVVAGRWGAESRWLVGVLVLAGLCLGWA